MNLNNKVAILVLAKACLNTRGNVPRVMKACFNAGGMFIE
jgi:hypothetical protein